MAVPAQGSPAEIAALTARLRASSSGAEVDEGERGRFLADKDQLIARIGRQAGRPFRPEGRNQAHNGPTTGTTISRPSDPAMAAHISAVTSARVSGDLVGPSLARVWMAPCTHEIAAPIPPPHAVHRIDVRPLGTGQGEHVQILDLGRRGTTHSGTTQSPCSSPDNPGGRPRPLCESRV